MVAGDDTTGATEVRTEISSPDSGMFAEKPARRAPVPMLPWVIAGVAILALAAGLVLMGHRKPPVNGVLPPDPHGAALIFSGLTLSESVSLSGGKSTYVDGTVSNTGGATVTSVTLQALFANDEGMPPQVETLPLALVRTREPYIDTQPVNAAPLRPGTALEFRLIFENITSNWNQRPPELRVVHVSAQ